MNLFLLQLHYLGTGENKKVGLLQIVTWIFSTFSHFDFAGSSSERKSLLSLELRYRWKQRHNTVCLCHRLCTTSAHSNRDKHALETIISQVITSPILLVFFLCIYSKVWKFIPRHFPLGVKEDQGTLCHEQNQFLYQRGLCSLRAEPGFGAAGFLSHEYLSTVQVSMLGVREISRGPCLWLRPHLCGPSLQCGC